MNKRTLIKLFSIASLFASCQSQENSMTQNDKIELFDQVWNIVNENFYDQQFNGINWNKKYTEYKPLIENCKSTDSIILLLNEMLYELNSSHCGIGLISKIKNEVSPYLFLNGEIGIDVRIIDNQIVVVKVNSNSIADSAKIKAGFIIKKVNGLSLNVIKKKVKYKPPYNDRNKKFHLTTEVLRHIYGQAGVPVKLDFLDKNNNFQSVVLTRTKRENGISLIDWLPEVFVESESYFLNENIAYLRFNGFQPENLDHVLKSFEKINNAKALIIDFRGNDGGSIQAMKLLLGHFVSKRIKYGTYINRNENNEDFIEPIANKYNGKVVCLVDEMSISGAENAPAILQQFNIATIIGNQTPGQLLCGNLYRINDTVSLVIPIYKLEYLNGLNPENKGVKPDIEIKLNRNDLLNGNDTQIEKAIQFLNN